KKSPSLWKPPDSADASAHGRSAPSLRLTMNPSPQVYGFATRCSPPTRSHAACHALGANVATSIWRCPGMWIDVCAQVDLSSGSYPSRVHTESVYSAAASGEKQS